MVLAYTYCGKYLVLSKEESPLGYSVWFSYFHPSRGIVAEKHTYSFGAYLAIPCVGLYYKISRVEQGKIDRAAKEEALQYYTERLTQMLRGEDMTGFIQRQNELEGVD